MLNVNKMKRKHVFFLTLLYLLHVDLYAQQKYSVLIKGGHVIDPKNQIYATMDVAITGTPGRSDGKIALIAKDIDPELAEQVVDARGLYVTPGLIDIHTHMFWGTDMQGTYRNGPNGLLPDGFTFPSGVTTVVDAGSSGWKTFETFKQQTIDISETRVLSMLNIVGEGMAGGRFENDTTQMDPEKTAEMARKYPDIIVGIKLAHFSGYTWTPTDRTLKAGKLAHVPIMVDFGGADPVLPLKTLYLEKFRVGDIYTHCFGGNSNNSGRGRESIVDVEVNKVKPFVWEAQKKGIIFDVGFGGASFLFAQAIPALKEGFIPNSISTDLHTGSMNNAMKSMTNIMSQFMAMGMTLQQVIAASTWHPAKEIKREELGSLSVGSVADVAVFRLREGDFGFYARDGKINGKNRLETEMTIRAGKIVYNLNALVDPINLPNARGHH